MEVRPLSQARIKPAYPKRQEESGSNPVQSGFESLRGHCAKALWKDQPRDGGGARFETGLPERACGFDPHSFRRSVPSGAATWAGSSAGRAPVSHTGGSGFETRPVHSSSPARCEFSTACRGGDRCARIIIERPTGQPGPLLCSGPSARCLGKKHNGGAAPLQGVGCGFESRLLHWRLRSPATRSQEKWRKLRWSSGQDTWFSARRSRVRIPYGVPPEQKNRRVGPLLRFVRGAPAVGPGPKSHDGEQAGREQLDGPGTIPPPGGRLHVPPPDPGAQYRSQPDCGFAGRTARRRGYRPVPSPCSLWVRRRPFKSVYGVRAPVGVRSALISGSSAAERPPVKRMVPGSNPGRRARSKDR